MYVEYTNIAPLASSFVTKTSFPPLNVRSKTPIVVGKSGEGGRCRVRRRRTVRAAGDDRRGDRVDGGPRVSAGRGGRTARHADAARRRMGRPVCLPAHRVQAIDLEVANWFTSTHPSSPFVRTLTARGTSARCCAIRPIRKSARQVPARAKSPASSSCHCCATYSSSSCPPTRSFQQSTAGLPTSSPELQEHSATSGGRANATTKTRRHED